MTDTPEQRIQAEEERVTPILFDPLPGALDPKRDDPREADSAFEHALPPSMALERERQMREEGR